MSEPDETAREVEALSQALQPLLYGKPPAVQGGALADLLAIWLAGHIHVDDPEETAQFRREILAVHVEGVWSLVEYHHRRMFGN